METQLIKALRAAREAVEEVNDYEEYQGPEEVKKALVALLNLQEAVIVELREGGASAELTEASES